MTTQYEIPTSAQPQKFAITLAGVTYNLIMVWNSKAACWVIDIHDVNDNQLVCGIPMVTGADLLAPYPHLGFGGTLTVSTDGNPHAIPTLDNLGTTGHLYFSTTP